MKKEKIHGAVFLLTKAFDTVDHGILMSKLSSVGVSPGLWSGFLHIWVIGISKPPVIVNYSKPFPLLSGFHKEASWDPYFSLCMSTSYLLLLTLWDIIVRWRYGSLLLRKRPRELESKLNANLYNVALWIKANRLTFNLSKTKSMWIGRNRKLFNISSLSLSIFECGLDRGIRFKYWGVLLASDLT